LDWVTTAALAARTTGLVVVSTRLVVSVTVTPARAVVAATTPTAGTTAAGVAARTGLFEMSTGLVVLSRAAAAAVAAMQASILPYARQSN